jgi:hypothetical protein
VSLLTVGLVKSIYGGISSQALKAKAKKLPIKTRRFITQK